MESRPPRGSLPDRDPGLQPERTSLAWARTTLGYVVVAAIVVRTAPHSGSVAFAVAAAYLLLAAWLLVRRAGHHVRSVEELRSGRPRPPVFEVLALGLGTSAIAAHWLIFAAPPELRNGAEPVPRPACLTAPHASPAAGPQMGRPTP